MPAGQQPALVRKDKRYSGNYQKNLYRQLMEVMAIVGNFKSEQNGIKRKSDVLQANSQPVQGKCSTPKGGVQQITVYLFARSNIQKIRFIRFDDTINA